MNLVDAVLKAGVVGAGGGGFPAHVKLSARAETIIANGAECEPLLHKDAAVMEHHAAAVVQGVRLSMEATGAKRGVIAIKAKNKHAVEACQAASKGTPVEVHLLGDYYPAGDEYDLVHEVTGKLIPPAGIPIQVGVVVNNVETLVNIAAAAEGRPVIHKTVTIAGAVKEPVTLTVPVGTSYRVCLEAAGGVTTDQPALCLGGLMMGEVSLDLDTPVTKTSTGVIVLPQSHHFVERKLRKPEQKARIGKSACDQCRYCTEFCPRFLLGYAVEPHQVMRGLTFTATGAAVHNDWAALCCSCGLCTLYACPEELYPKEACDDAKAEMRKAARKYAGKMEVKLHPMYDGRRVPINSLMRRLAIEEYKHDAPLRPGVLKVDTLVLPLKQSAGAPAEPRVKEGDKVKAGAVIAGPAEKALGALIHSPIEGTIAAVTARAITITR